MGLAQAVGLRKPPHGAPAVNVDHNSGVVHLGFGPASGERRYLASGKAIDAERRNPHTASHGSGLRPTDVEADLLDCVVEDFVRSHLPVRWSFWSCLTRIQLNFELNEGREDVAWQSTLSGKRVVRQSEVG